MKNKFRIDCDSYHKLVKSILEYKNHYQQQNVRSFRRRI